MELIAEKKGVTAADVQNAILSVGGPQFAGTKADNVKFHDDKSLYTGVYAQGGPTNIDSVHPAASFGSAPDKEEDKKEEVKAATKKMA